VPPRQATKKHQNQL